MRYFRVFLLFTLILVSSCSQSLDQRLSTRLDLPPWPPCETLCRDWPALDFWTIELYDGCEARQFTLPSDSSFLDISLTDIYPAAVLVTPVTAGLSFFQPAGAILPYEKSLSWQSGFSADVLKKLYLSTTQNDSEQRRSFASQFNWQKFQETVSSKASSSSVFYNPWLLDQSTILNKIFSESFTAASLTLKKCHAADVEYSALSPYVPENLLSEQNTTFTISENYITKLLLWNDAPKILTATVNSSGTLSLAINSLPL